jgi:hypothetical protein
MLKKALLVLTLATALSAVALSARQLTIAPRAGTACGSPCVKTTTTCMKPCYCFVTQEGSINGVCQPEGPAPFRRPSSKNSGQTGF